MTAISDSDPHLDHISACLDAEWQAQVATTHAILDAITSAVHATGKPVVTIQVMEDEPGSRFLVYEYLDRNGKPVELGRTPTLDVYVSMLMPESLSQVPERITDAGFVGPVGPIINIHIGLSVVGGGENS